MSADIDTLARLVRRHADQLPLPTHIVRGGAAIPLNSWLGNLSTDRRPAPTSIGWLLGHPSEQPTVCEIALTLRAQLSEHS